MTSFVPFSVKWESYYLVVLELPTECSWWSSREFGQQTHGTFQQCPTNHPYGEPQKQNMSKKNGKMGMRWGESEAITIITIITIVGWTSIYKLLSALLGTRVLTHSQTTPQAANTRNNHVWISSWNLLIFSTSTCLTISWMGKLNTI